MKDSNDHSWTKICEKNDACTPRGGILFRVQTDFVATNAEVVRVFFFSCVVDRRIVEGMMRYRQNEDALVATLCPAMLPVRGKTWQHCCAPPGHKEKCFWRFSETFFVSATNVARVAKRVSTFRKHDHVSDVAATMCPRFAGPLTLSLPRVINFKFPLQPHKKHRIKRMKNLTSISLLRWQMIILPILTTVLITFHFKSLEECTLWTWSKRVNMVSCFVFSQEASVNGELPVEPDKHGSAGASADRRWGWRRLVDRNVDNKYVVSGLETATMPSRQSMRQSVS